MLRRLFVFVIWGLAIIFLLSSVATLAVGGILQGIVQFLIGGLLLLYLIRRRRWQKRQV